MTRPACFTVVFALLLPVPVFAETLVSGSSTELDPKTRRHEFRLETSQKVAYEFETQKQGAGSSFRIRLYQKLPRGTYKAVGTVVLERGSKKGKAVVPMKAGPYRIDVASKRMHYRFRLWTETDE